jgi:hypothetical protein
MSEQFVIKPPRYIRFPLFLLRPLLINRIEVLTDMFHYGIFYFAVACNYSLHDIARQCLYAFYRKDKRNDALLLSIRNALKRYADKDMFDQDFDYSGFQSDGTGFNPGDEYGQLLKLFEHDEKLLSDATEYCQVKGALKLLGIDSNIDHIIKNAKRIFAMTPPKEPIPMVSVRNLFNVYNNEDNDKTEFALMQFASFIAISSMLGKDRKYCLTTHDFIRARAFGYSSIKQVPQEKVEGKPVYTLESEELTLLFNKYKKRHHAEKVIKALQRGWEVETYSKGQKGFYVTVGDRITLNNLALIAEGSKPAMRDKLNKHRKNEATKYALAKLNSIYANDAQQKSCNGELKLKIVG